MLIFAIDDEENVLEYNKEIIENASGGAEVMTFKRGGTALDAIRQGYLPDVVFTDIEMPGVSGLELAVKIKELSPRSRIVFTTGYEKYAYEAFKIRAHGYLLKPIKTEDIKEELEYVPKRRRPAADKLEIRCFGHFDVLWQGQPLIFGRKQSKELLAYLVDRDGAACTSGEIALALWQEGGDTRAEQNRIRVLVNDLKNTLKSIGMEKVLIREHGETAIRRDLVDCDYYRMLEGDPDAINEYRGQYMVEYSWAEIRNADLLQFIKN